MHVVELNGREIDSKASFMEEMDRAFGFPPYFGRNWDALSECMNDLYWIEDNEIHIKILESNFLFGKHRVNTISFFESLTERWKKESEEGKSTKTLKVDLL